MRDGRRRRRAGGPPGRPRRRPSPGTSCTCRRPPASARASARRRRARGTAWRSSSASPDSSGRSPAYTPSMSAVDSGRSSTVLTWSSRYSMSRAEAAGWARSSCQSVSVVPMIQCPPHGMTNSTEVAVRRISPASPVIAERGTTRCTPLEARTRSPGRTPTSPSICGHVVAPHPGGGDDRAGPHLELGVRVPGRASRSRTRTPVTSRACAHQADGAGAGHHGRAQAGRGAGQRDHQPGVVDLAVVVADRAGRSRRRAGSGRAAGRPSRVRCRCSGMPRPRAEDAGERVVRRHARAVVGRAGTPGPAARAGRCRGQRHQDRHRPDQVRGEPGGEQATLGERLVHQVRTRAAPGSAGRRGSACWTGWTCRRRGRAPRPGRPSARGRRRPARRRRR